MSKVDRSMTAIYFRGTRGKARKRHARKHTYKTFGASISFHRHSMRSQPYRNDPEAILLRKRMCGGGVSFGRLHGARWRRHAPGYSELHPQRSGVVRAALCAFHLNIHKKRAGRTAARPARTKHLPEILSRKASPIGERSACLGQCLRQCSPFPPPDCRSIPRVPGYIAPKCRISCRKYRLPRSRGNPFHSRPAT